MAQSAVARSMPHRLARMLCFTVLAIASMFAASAGHAASLTDVFSKSDESSARTIDHSPWTRLIGAYLSPGPGGLNVFDYAAVTKADRRALTAYLDDLQAVRVTALSRQAQMPYWINLYNALTVNVILDNYPVKSIREIKSGLFSSGPWSTELVRVEGYDLSLDDIEHEILRPIWRDKRIHYVVNCASIGCPNLAAKAYTRGNTADLLDSGARDYINSPRGVRIDDGRIVASKLYTWYDDDFGSEQEVLSHIRQYAGPDLLAQLKGKTDIYDYEYDWALNSPR